MQVDEQIHIVQIGPIAIWGNIFSSVYAIVGDGITLIDSGLPGSFEEFIIPYLRKIGRNPEHISLVICTHSHVDHAGSIEAIQKFCGAKIAINEFGAEELESPGFLRRRYLEKNSQYMIEGDKRLLMKEPLSKKT